MAYDANLQWFMIISSRLKALSVEKYSEIVTLIYNIYNNLKHSVCISFCYDFHVSNWHYIIDSNNFTTNVNSIETTTALPST